MFLFSFFVIVIVLVVAVVVNVVITVLFAVARTTGWIAQWNEMITDPTHTATRQPRVEARGRWRRRISSVSL